MKFKDCQFTPKNRRGLSSVVGALLFVVLMVATFAVLGVALDSQTEIVDTGREVADTSLKKQQEEFGIAVSTNGTEILSIDVNNVGQNPVEIFTIVMTNVTDVGFPTTIIEIPSDTSFIPSGDKDDIVSTLDLKMKLAPSANLTSTYNFKVVSSLGTIKTATLQCSFTECGTVTLGGDLIIQLFSDGPTGVNTKISTIVMFVTNTADFEYTDVTPTRGVSDAPATCNAPDSFGDPFWEVLIAGTPDVFSEAIAPCDFDAFAPVDLQPGQTTLFKWDATISGDIDTVFEFCNGVEGKDDLGDLQTFGEECDTLTIVDPNDCGGCGPGGDLFILIDDLLVRPSLWMIIPSPFGLAGADEAAIWGVNVVNPTEKTMNVTKMTIVSYPPGANANHLVFDPNFCGLIPIEPLTDWTCPGENTIMWNNAAGIEIPPYSAQEMLTLVEPGSISGSIDLDALIVQANAFTTAGSFGKSGYQTTMYDDQEVMANVFLTDADLGLGEDPTDITHIISKKEGIQDLVPYEFQITLADMDEDNDSFIGAGASLVINVPREWTNVTITGDANFEPDGGTTAPDDDRVTEFNDSSTQIRATSAVDIGGNVNGDDLQDHLTLTFTAIPPDNEGLPFRPYIMYTFAYGETGNCIPDNPNPCIPTPRQIGPLSEIFLQVID